MNSIGNTDTNSNDTSNMGTSPVVVSVVAPHTTVHSNSVPHGEKPEKFIGVEIQKMASENAFLSHDPQFGKILEWESSRHSRRRKQSGIIDCFGCLETFRFLV
ncbi:Uncharacterized protein Adt_36598 [Abeliophyllum distichum]|uniref:Uncharacterized protein n=1 Tax=Abeliophyllum distichum TaxID=126358 RepID=A0ABD1QI10_9LAMI